MAKPVIQYDAGKLTAIAAGTDNQVLTYDTGTSEASFQSVPYDIAGSAAGTPTASSYIFFFKAVRGCTVASSGHQGGVRVAPSATTTFDVYYTAPAGSETSIGTISISTLGVMTFSISQQVMAVGGLLTVKTQASLNSLSDPYFTLSAVVS